MLASIITAATLIAFPPPEAQPDTPPFVVSCLGTDRIAADPAALAKLHAVSSEAEWTKACHDAREANDSRLTLTLGLFGSPSKSAAGYESVQTFVALADSESDPVLVELFSRSARDQAIRSSLTIYNPPYTDSLSPAAKALLDALVAGDAVASDADNRQWLRRTVSMRGWFTVSRDGPKADRAAWLMVQHSDSDRAFQREMIDLLEPLVAKHETDGPRFAGLFDRWAEGAGQPQRFGLGGGCEAPGRWKPLPMEDPRAVDQRRAAVGIKQTEEQFIAEMSADCH